MVCVLLLFVCLVWVFSCCFRCLCVVVNGVCVLLLWLLMLCACVYACVCVVFGFVGGAFVVFGSCRLCLLFVSVLFAFVVVWCCYC